MAKAVKETKKPQEMLRKGRKSDIISLIFNESRQKPLLSKENFRFKSLIKALSFEKI